MLRSRPAAAGSSAVGRRHRITAGRRRSRIAFDRRVSACGAATQRRAVAIRRCLGTGRGRELLLYLVRIETQHLRRRRDVACVPQRAFGTAITLSRRPT